MGVAGKKKPIESNLFFDHNLRDNSRLMTKRDQVAATY
jgi:hypothetical protein